MYRFFADPAQIGEKQISITGSDVNHIKNVLRMRQGEEILISDGGSKEYTCYIQELHEEEILAHIMYVQEAGYELPSKLYLFQGLPKGDKMELIIQKAVELGVHQVIPVASKRAVVKLLEKRNINMEPKAFAVGLRAEHPQTMINLYQYGKEEPGNLGAASYKLTHRGKNGRGIYSFCMCPGGYVVNASSEPGRLAVNGMSYHDRGSRNANSALIVTVTPEDFSGSGPLAGVEFQRELEEKAWNLGQGKIPLQLYGDFCQNQDSSVLGQVTPCTKGAWSFSNLRKLFPDQISETLIEGIQAFGEIIPGFDREDMVLTGVESRTSSPVRIPRDDSFQCNVEGIYPCGEGAGYAGGITSAAMDGLKTGEAIVKKIRNLF